MTRVIYRSETFGDEDWHVCLCPELAISGSGATREDAIDSLGDAVEAYLGKRADLGNLSDVLEGAGFEKSGDVWRLGGRAIEQQTVVVNATPRENHGVDSTPKKTRKVRLKSGHDVEFLYLSEADVRKRMAELESKHGLTSREFMAKWNAGTLTEEKPDFFRWAGYCESASYFDSEGLRITTD